MPRVLDGVPQKSSAPSKRAVRSQVAKLTIDHSKHLRGAKLRDFVKFVVELELEGIWFARKPAGKQTLFKFYDQWNRKNNEPPPASPDTTEIPGKNLVARVVAGLRTHYSDPANDDDPVLVTIQTGRENGYRPLITGRSPRTNPAASIQNQQTASLLGPDEWGFPLIRACLESAKAGDEVRIWVTFFDDDEIWGTFKRILDKDVKVSVLMMNPRKIELVRSRFRNRERYGGPLQVVPATAIKQIGDQFNDLIRLDAGRGLMTPKYCDTVPFGAFFQVSEKAMFVGFLLPHETWRAGPLLNVPPRSKEWEIFQASWKACWLDPADEVGLDRKKSRETTE